MDYNPTISESKNKIIITLDKRWLSSNLFILNSDHLDSLGYELKCNVPLRYERTYTPMGASTLNFQTNIQSDINRQIWRSINTD